MTYFTLTLSIDHVLYLLGHANFLCIPPRQQIVENFVAVQSIVKSVFWNVKQKTAFTMKTLELYTFIETH